MPAERIVSSLDKAMGELQKLQRMRTWEQTEVAAVELSLGDEAVTHLEGERIEFEKQSQFPPVPVDVTSSTEMDYKNTARSGLRKNKANPGLRPETLNSKSSSKRNGRSQSTVDEKTKPIAGPAGNSAPGARYHK